MPAKNKLQRYALLSVFDKSGIVELATQLQKLGFKIISTGGTAKTLENSGIKVIPIQQITGNPESFDGRMKTISFQVESGILYDREKKKHQAEAKKLKIKPIDVVVCNLYPFEQTISNQKVKLANAIESIDVGGPTMIRSAAKNFQNVLVVVDPKDYQQVTNTMQHKKLTEKFRRTLAGKAFQHLSFYDSQIGNYLSEEKFPSEVTLAGRKSFQLRYGENPHQKGAVYLTPNTNSPLSYLKKLWGRGLSHVNITDINAGLESVRMFKQPAAVVIKHNTPCGIALGRTAKEALSLAIEADPESAFGGVIVLNTTFDKDCARLIATFKDRRRSNIDIVAAPQVKKDALELLSKVRKSMGVYSFGKIPTKRSDRYNLKWIDGGYILQTSDDKVEKGFKDWKVVSKLKPTKQQLEQMRVAWQFISRIRSNAIIIVDKKLPMTRGIGTGQTSRVRSTKIALSQAGDRAKGAVLASDSFFPFDDSVKLASHYKVGVIVQQGGSVNDQASIDAANKAKMIMVFTNRRAFWH